MLCRSSSQFRLPALSSSHTHMAQVTFRCARKCSSLGHETGGHTYCLAAGGDISTAMSRSGWRACLSASHFLLLQMHVKGNLKAVFAVQTCCRSSRALQSKRESPPRMCCYAAPRFCHKNSPSGSSPMPSIWCTDSKAATRYLHTKSGQMQPDPTSKGWAGSHP